MKIILFSGPDCNICEEAEGNFKNIYKDELKSGEAEIKHLDEDEEAYSFWLQNELPLAPCVAVVSDAKSLIAVLNIEGLLDKEGLRDGEDPASVSEPT